MGVHLLRTRSGFSSSLTSSLFGLRLHTRRTTPPDGEPVDYATAAAVNTGDRSRKEERR